MLIVNVLYCDVAIADMRGGHSASRRVHSVGHGENEISTADAPTSTAPPAICAPPNLDVGTPSVIPQTEPESSIGSAPAGSSQTCSSTQRGNTKNISTVDRDNMYEVNYLL